MSANTKEMLDYIVQRVASQTRTFGGGRTSEWNPIANALSDKPPQFAAGVDVATVVCLVLESYVEFHKENPE